MFIDNCALNKVMIKNNYPLPCIDNLLDWLNGVKNFNWINIKLKYYQIHIVDEDVELMAMKITCGFYEFLVMPFGLCDAPLMFTTFLNLIFHEKLDEFVIIYIDNILVYSKIAKKHVEH